MRHPGLRSADLHRADPADDRGPQVRAGLLTERFSRAPADVRRLALLEAAVQSLAARGLGAVSVRDVAARAGVTPGLIRHHFGSFGALLTEAYRHVVETVDGGIAAAVETAGADPQARMDAFLQASFSPQILDRDLLSAWLGFWGLVRSDPAAAAVHAETFAAYRRRIEDLVAALNPRADARLAALGLSALLDGLWLELCLDPSTFTPQEAVRLAQQWVACYTSV